MFLLKIWTSIKHSRANVVSLSRLRHRVTSLVKSQILGRIAPLKRLAVCVLPSETVFVVVDINNKHKMCTIIWFYHK